MESSKAPVARRNTMAFPWDWATSRGSLSKCSDCQRCELDAAPASTRIVLVSVGLACLPRQNATFFNRADPYQY